MVVYTLILLFSRAIALLSFTIFTPVMIIHSFKMGFQ